MLALVNLPYPNRIQLRLTPLVGPLVSISEGAFEGTQDVTVYVDGKVLPIGASFFDVTNNRYLLYSEKNFNLNGVIQVLCPIPASPFEDNNSVMVPGFSLIANYSVDGDVAGTPQVFLTIAPPAGLAHSSFNLLWNSIGVDSIRIVGGAIDTGVISSLSGFYTVFTGVSVTTEFTITGYLSSVAVATDTALVTVGGSGFGIAFGSSF